MNTKMITKPLHLVQLLCYNFHRVTSECNYINCKAVRQMSRKCEVCGKGQTSGNAVSHSNRHSKRKWNANIQSVRISENGTVRKANVCTSCLRSGKVDRAI